MALTANEKIADGAIRHAVLLERLKGSVSRDILELLESGVLADLMRQIEGDLPRILNGQNLTEKLRRLRDLVAATNELVRGGFKGARTTLAEQLRGISRTESQWLLRLMRSATPINLDFVTPSASVLEAAATRNPFLGGDLNSWFDGLTNGTQKRLQRSITLGVTEGESIREITNRVRDNRILGTVRRNVESVVRTSVTGTVNSARETTYAANQGTIKGVQYVATLDARTTLICADLDGKVFPVEEGPRPPQHVRCRSSTVPVLKSWKELGIPLADAPPGTRASMNGQVAANVTYGEWLKGQPASIQDEVLGQTRGRLFRDEGFKIGQFVDDRSRPITLAELRMKEGLD